MIYEELGNSDKEMQQMVALHLNLVDHYYSDVLKQANASFWCAVFFAASGFGVLVYTIYAVVNPNTSNPVDVGTIGLVSGGLIEFISAIVFFIYRRATEQFNTFHLCLERAHRHVMAFLIDDMADGEDREKDGAKHQLAYIIANAPMIMQKHAGFLHNIGSTLPRETSPLDTQKKNGSASNGTAQSS
jgi:hypothetical protein